MLHGNKYKYILSEIDVTSRYKVAGPLRTKQAKDIAEMIAEFIRLVLSLISRYSSVIMVVSSKQRHLRC